MSLPAFQPASRARSGEITIIPSSYQSLGMSTFVMAQPSYGSNNNPGANVGWFVPFTVPEPVTVTKLFWGNGAAVAGNVDAGIFQEDGTRLVSAGTTAQSGTSNLQVVDVTDTRLERGRYYLGLCGDTTGTTQRFLANTSAAGIWQALGVLKDSSCAPPMSTNANPATFEAYDLAWLPLVGLQGFREVGP